MAPETVSKKRETEAKESVGPFFIGVPRPLRDEDEEDEEDEEVDEADPEDDADDDSVPSAPPAAPPPPAATDGVKPTRTSSVASSASQMSTPGTDADDVFPPSLSASPPADDAGAAPEDVARRWRMTATRAAMSPSHWVFARVRWRFVLLASATMSDPSPAVP
jgi:hypothetical protein